MAIRNTIETYGSVAKTFHWIIGLLILGLLALGLYMTRLPVGPKMFQLFGLHKSFGITVLALGVLRVLWRITNAHVASLPTHQRWEVFLAQLVHLLLYAAIFIMPLSGWMMSSAKGFSVSFFGLFTLPDLIAPNEQLAHILAQVHGFSAYTLIVIIGLHIAGAFKHYLIDHDTTLMRMLPSFSFSKKGQ